jgi:hypothetical protein
LSLGLGQLANENSPSTLNGWHANSIAEKSQLIGAIVCGDVQDGIVQPMGKPISVSTQRGLSLPLLRFMSSGSIDLAPDPPSKPWLSPLPVHEAGVGHIPLTISGKFCPRDSHCLQASGVVAPLWSQALGVAHCLVT